MPWYKMYELEERVGDEEELVVPSPATASAPHTPEVAATRSTVHKVDRDYDEEVESVSYDDEEEPVAVSRVRAFAMARRECKVTLETARAKLDGVKAAREKHLKKRKLEDALLSSEFQGKVSLKKARAQLEAVEIEKDLEKAIISSSGKATKACGVDEELGVWVRQAKLKLDAARAKTLKTNCKRKSGTKREVCSVGALESYLIRNEMGLGTTLIQ